MKTHYGTSKHYEGQKGSSYFAYQNRSASIGAKLNAVKFQFSLAESDSVLDFGCGGGWLLGELKCGKKVGVELNEAAHPDCIKNGIKVYKYIEDVEERNFDVIISNHCLEHVPYPIEALRSLRTHLSPTGKIVIVVPIDDWRTQKDFDGTDIDHHLHTWTPRLMANTLVEAGFTPINIAILSHAWFPGWAKVYGRLPDSLFSIICRFWSVARRRRQLIVQAKSASLDADN